MDILKQLKNDRAGLKNRQLNIDFIIMERTTEKRMIQEQIDYLDNLICELES